MRSGRISALCLALLAASCGGSDGAAGAAGDGGAGDAGSVLPGDAAAADAATRADAPAGRDADGDDAVDTSTSEPRGHLIAGLGEPGHDAALAAKARRYDRTWRLFNASAMSLNTDVAVAVANADDRALIEDFIANGDGWEAEFEARAGRPPAALITAQHKVAGLYAGVGIAADAYRYGVLRDQGAPAEAVDRAREHLLRDLEALHIVVAITGVEGVIARGLQVRALWPGHEGALVPLFDEQGAPLPTEKNNGAWRADNSPDGAYPHLVWEDSVSRDQLVGWVAAFGAAWEVIGEDDSIPAAAKATLQADARALGHALMTVRDSGYDLEVPDADGRTTLHGWLHHENFDGKFYRPGIENGFHATMALGMVASYAYASGDPALQAYVRDELIAARELPRIILEHIADFNDIGYGSNFSNYNMTFMGLWLAFRYIDDAAVRAALREAAGPGLYDRPGRDFQPVDHGYSFYDFTYAAGLADASAFSRGTLPLDQAAVDRGLATLRAFREPPYWNIRVENCPVLEQFDCKAQYRERQRCDWDEAALAEPCVGIDGTTELTPLGCAAWKCSTAVSAALPWHLQRPSNYHWRSAPHEPNGGGDGSGMLPGVDFRFAYWLGRWTRL